MPRKQARQASRKRLWFNVVEFDKETGRPLWRNKKTKLDSDLPPCIVDPTFTALLDKLREETESALNINTPNNNTQSPCSMVWRNNQTSRFKLREPVKNLPPQHNFYRNIPCQEVEPTSPKLVMQFQPFSPLIHPENEPVGIQKRQIHDFLKMKPVEYGRGQQRVTDFDNNRQTSRNCYPNDTFVSDADVLTSDWDTTVRLHHVDYDKTYMYENNCDFNSDQKVPLAIF